MLFFPPLSVAMAAARLDWMLPQAWDVEHNKAHHYYLSEEKDPDLVEHNFELLRAFPLPRAMKYASMVCLGVLW